MRLWRIARAAYQALDGEGARLFGGRWNSEGVPVVYASPTLSLAALEYLVHVQIEDVPDDLVSLEIDVPDDAPVEQVAAFDLPADWNQVEDHPACATLGDAWATENHALLLRVPSAIIPHELNVLLNPRHSDMDRVRVVAVTEFSFDPRPSTEQDLRDHWPSSWLLIQPFSPQSLTTLITTEPRRRTGVHLGESPERRSRRKPVSWRRLGNRSCSSAPVGT